jgi:hypothetical protein
MKEDCLKIIEHYGVNHQQRKLAEEVFELQEAIICAEYNRYIGIVRKPCDKCIDRIAEEIADVRVMLQEFQSYYDIGNEQLGTIMYDKIQRTLKRMEKE